MGSHLFSSLILATLFHTMVALLPACHAHQPLHPIILIPGSGGNQLEARLTGNYKPPTLFCKLLAAAGGSGSSAGAGKWFRLWFDPKLLLAPFTRCFADRMTLHYDEDLDDYRNTPGVETRVPYFGSTQGLLYLDPTL